MTEITIPLGSLIINPEDNPNLDSMSEEALVQIIRESYDFLGTDAELSLYDEALHIELSEPSLREQDRAMRTYNRAVDLGERASSRKAVRLFQEVLESLPGHTDARRNLAMAYLEAGNPETAKEILIQTLRLNPEDAWAYVLLGNIAARHEDNPDRALGYFEQAAEIAPRDPLIVTNYAAILAKQDHLDEASDYFLRAIEIEPTYPNPYYALAKIAYDQGQPMCAIQVLDNMFDIGTSPEVRNQPLFKEARELYLQANMEAAEASREALMELVERRAEEVAGLSGYPVQLVEEPDLEVSATTRIAWRHDQDHHLLRYRTAERADTPALLMHELEHIVMEAEAREAGRNRIYVSTRESDRKATQAMEDHARTLKGSGKPDAFVEQWTARTLDIVRSQLYNIPMDLIIEQRLTDRYEALRASQFVSLFNMHTEAAPMLSDEYIRNTTAPIIYRATVSLNHALALFADRLYGDRTNYASIYEQEMAAADGQWIFNLWQRTMRNFRPGDEYRLIDQVAEVLGLDGWYEWRTEEVGSAPTTEEPEPEGATDEDLLRQKEPAVMMYCLDALQRFSKRSDDEVMRIASEIAMMGQGGLDYTSSEKQYELRSIPGETFSGLHLLSLMYVGFQRVNPELDLRLSFENAYRDALAMFEDEDK